MARVMLLPGQSNTTAMVQIRAALPSREAHYRDRLASNIIISSKSSNSNVVDGGPAETRCRSEQEEEQSNSATACGRLRGNETIRTSHRWSGQLRAMELSLLKCWLAARG